MSATVDINGSNWDEITNTTNWDNITNTFNVELCERRNSSIQKALITFALINLILTFQLSTGIWKHRKANLPRLASLLWFIATVLNGINRANMNPISVSVDITALVFDFSARMACITYHLYRIFGEFPKTAIYRSIFMILPLNLVAAFCIGVYGIGIQTNPSKWLY
jgi:hypothetical protein